MRYVLEDNSIVLMHKNIPVAHFNIDSYTGRIISKISILNHEHLPIPVQCNSGNDFTAVDAMQNWVAFRSIPASRSHFTNYLEKLGVVTPSAAAYKSLGLNLSDQYWYRPLHMDIDWRDINLFENSFLRETFQSHASNDGSFISPDSNSNGELPKFWCIEHGKRLLYKQGSGPLYQQPYNEVFASTLLDKLQISHVSYQLNSIGDKPYSVCETFVDDHTEYIPASDILMMKKHSNNDNAYQHFFKCIEALKIDVPQQAINNILIFDCLINNIDRHYGNFGFIRDADTLEFKGLAPVFDNGNSLWYNVSDCEIITRNQPAKPFRNTQEQQLKLIKSSALLLSMLDDNFVKKAAYDIFAPAVKTGRISIKRVESIIRNVNYNVLVLHKFQEQINNK